MLYISPGLAELGIQTMEVVKVSKIIISNKADPSGFSMSSVAENSKTIVPSEGGEAPRSTAAKV